MIPLFNGPEKRRRDINLGGTSTAISQRDVLQRVKAERELRHEETRRAEATVKLQATWRGVMERRRLRHELLRVFAEDVTGINAMRCLVMMPGSDTGAIMNMLDTWSEAICTGNEGTRAAYLGTNPSY